MQMSNQKLMKYLRPFSEDEKHHYLKNIFKKCSDLTGGNALVIIQMMTQLKKEAYVKLDCLDITQYWNEYKKKEKIFTEVEKNLEELFTSNSSLDQTNTIKIDSKCQKLLNHDFILPSLSGSSDEKPRDNMNIKQSKIEGIKKNKSVSKAVNLIHRVAATDKCNNTVECEKYSQKTTSKLVSHGKKKNKTAKSMSNNKLKTNTNSPHRASATDNCKNTVECEKVSQKTISKLVLRNKKINKTEKHMSNNRSKTNKNSPHGASETDKCNNNVECEKDSQKIISKLILLSKKKNKTVKHMSNNRSKTKHNSSHNAFANDKCNNTADYINYSQKCHNLSKYIDSNDTRMDINMNNIEESSMNKSTILEQVFKTKSRKVSILNSTDLTQNPSTNTKSVVYNSSSNPIGNMNFATGIHYEMLRIIIYKNYYFYNRNCLCKLAKIFTEKHLLLNLPESWHPNAVQLVKSLLEDLFKLLKHFKFKKVVFTACLSVLYRRINFSYKSEEMYRYFIVFIDVIKMCTMRIDEHLWKSLIPNDWNKIFINGCLIIDYILYGNLTNSMYLYVDWDAMPDVKVLYNTYLNELQSQNLLNSTSTELEQLEIYISVNDWFSDSPILTDDCESSDDISFFTNTSKMKVVTAPLGDELDSVDVQSKRPDIIKNSSISGFSCMNTFTIMQNNDKENKKRKHSISQTNVDEQVVKKIPSHYTIHQLHAQSMCLQTPKFPRSNNQFKQRSDDHTLFNEEVQSEPISLHTNIEDLSKLQNIQDYEPQRVQYGFTQNIQLFPALLDAKNSYLP